MIAVGIFGGLASQMNQYAFLKLIKRRFPEVDVKMALGDGWRKFDEHNGYELDNVFGIERNAISWEELRRLANFYPGSGFSTKVLNALFLLRSKLFGAKGTQIQLPVSDIPDWSVLNLDVSRDWLFWSNYPMGFFDEIRTELLHTFRFPVPDKANLALLEAIDAANSVSIHVRRGDYIKRRYPILDISWYRNAVKTISAKVDDPHFFIFSDDPGWTQNNFDFIPRKTIVMGNSGTRDWIDMMLMSHCKHNIIANSTYSLFASWLNTNPNKIVIKPDVYPFGTSPKK